MGVGLKYRDSESERGSSMVLVDWMFFCCPQRCPLLVVSDFGRCFLMRDVVSPGQDDKCPRFMARRNVDGMGMYAAPWRKAARSDLLCWHENALAATWKGLGVNGIFQRPF